MKINVLLADAVIMPCFDFVPGEIDGWPSKFILTDQLKRRNTAGPPVHFLQTCVQFCEHVVPV